MDDSTREYRAQVRSELLENPFSKTTAIHFEISNRCNLASRHPNCPVGPVFEAERKNAGGTLKYADYLSQGTYLSLEAVNSCLSELGQYNFEGTINFHRYNEPLIELDKLMRLVASSRAQCPRASILIYTNAIPMTREIADELIELGATKFVVSAYNQVMENRVNGIYEQVSRSCAANKVDVDTQILNFKSKDKNDKWGNSKLDDRLTIYDRAARGEERKSKYGPCLAPLNDITVSHTGDVVACCLDWKDTVAFGNINIQSLTEIARSEYALEIYCDLSRDIRKSPICKACGWSR